MRFYDTCSLLAAGDRLENVFIISSVSLNELENIKTSAHKDADTKYQARKLLHQIDQSNCRVHAYQPIMMEVFNESAYEITPDLKILACAMDYFDKYDDDNKEFITNDLLLKLIAEDIFKESDVIVSSVDDDPDDGYSGYYETILTDEELEYFYNNQSENMFNLQVNEYLLIYNENKELIDTRCWTGSEYRFLDFNNFNSKWFGEVKPMRGDAYQRLAADSLAKNQITMLKGPAGSGKTFLALGYLLSRLERGKIDKIIVFCNTVATKNSAKLGYYPGTRDEKLLDSQIGNLLSSKLGGRIAVEQMIDNEKLILLPLSDIRGYDTTGMRAGIYISEAQNLDITLMKLALQRIGEDSICIIDGDAKTQVDDINFAGANNGMRRVSKVFRGEDIYGEVELRNIHRSRIAQIAELL